MDHFHSKLLHYQRVYPPAIRHGVLENPSFTSLIFPSELNNHFDRGFPIAMFDEHGWYHPIFH